jgi:NADH-ubiquinone oxidoreductase chain 4
MFNRIAFGGSFSLNNWLYYMPDLNKREYSILLVLVLFTVILGIYPSIVLDSLHYYTYHLIYTVDYINNNDFFLN